MRPDSVLVQRDSRTLRALSPEAAAKLARLIDTFEDYPSIPDNPHWEASAAFRVYIDEKASVVATQSSVVRVETAEGSYSGFALYTTDSVLVMAPEVRPRDAGLQGAYAVRRADILGISQQQPTGWQKWGQIVSLGIGAGLGAAFSPDMDPIAGASFGALVGLTAGTLTSQQSKIGRTQLPLSSLDSLALFNRSRPPELPDGAGAIARATSSPSASRTRRLRARSFEWVSIGIHGAVSVSDDQGAPVIANTAQTLTLPQTFRSGALERERDGLSVPYRLDASVRPIKWLRAGVFAGSFTSGDSLRNLPGEEQQLRSVGRVRPYAEAILPLARSGDQRLEVFVGGGRQAYAVRAFQVTPLTVEVGRSGSTRPLGVTPEQQDTRAEGDAWFYTAGIEIHTTRFSSLFIRHSWHPIPALAVDAFRYRTARGADLSLRVIDAHEVDFSYRELMIGSRFHF